MEKLNFGDSQVLYDQLLYIAEQTRYPLNTTKKSKKTYDLRWLTEDDYDIMDWLLHITIENRENNKTRIACIIASLHWCLSRNDMDLSPFLKSHGLNSTYADFLCSEYLKIFYL